MQSEKIKIANGKLIVPENPIIPFIPVMTSVFFAISGVLPGTGYLGGKILPWLVRSWLIFLYQLPVPMPTM